MASYQGIPRLHKISLGFGNLFNPRRLLFSSYAGSGGGGPPDDRITGNDLASVSFYEVKLAKEIIGRQLLNDAYLSELRENFMCNLYLDASLAKCPPQIFGRVIRIV